MSLHTRLYNFILKYNIYNFVCKLQNFFKFERLLLKLLSSSLFHGYSNVKVLDHSQYVKDSIANG